MNKDQSVDPYLFLTFSALSQAKLIGYRLPSFSFGAESPWSFSIWVEALSGFCASVCTLTASARSSRDPRALLSIVHAGVLGQRF